MTTLNFDASKVEPSVIQDPVPAGWYNVLIENSEMKPASTPGNAYLQLVMKILDGQYAGRKLFSRHNIINASAQAQEIAFRELSSVCRAVGKMQVGDSAELHNVPLMAKVKVVPADAKYEAKNEVTAFAHISQVVGQAPGAAGVAPWAPPAPTQPPSVAATPPAQWQQPPATQQWQPPAHQQPWQQPQAPATAPPVATAPPAQWQQPPATVQTAPPPVAPVAPVQQAPAQGATPPWMAQQAPGAAPPWAAQPPTA